MVISRDIGEERNVVLVSIAAEELCILGFRDERLPTQEQFGRFLWSYLAAGMRWEETAAVYIPFLPAA